MFGYVTANISALSQQDRQLYQGLYCGLCRSLGKQFGIPGRLTLRYDMVLLELVLSDVYGSALECGCMRCLLHPFRRRCAACGSFSDYSAAMNVALAYYNCRDRWDDSRNIPGGLAALLLRRACRRVRKQYPRQCDAMERGMAELLRMERAGEPNPDRAAQVFGTILGAVFVPYEDEHARDLFEFGAALGRYLYILDAAVDLRDDLQHRRYNPLVTVEHVQIKDILNMLLHDCTCTLDALGTQQYRSIYQNIFYSGIWLRFDAADQRRKGTSSDGTGSI